MVWARLWASSDGELSSGWESERLAVRGRDLVTSSLVLHPEILKDKSGQGVNGEVGVLVVNRTVVPALGYC